MTESSPPPIPAKGGSKSLIVAATLMLAGVIGIVIWTTTRANGPAQVDNPTSAPEPTATRARLQSPPPPPPPPPEPSAEEATTAPKASPKAAPTPSPKGTSAGCSGVCSGTPDPTFRAALRQRAGLAKGCYDRALRSNSSLEGKMTVALRISPTGSVCSVTTQSNSLADPLVTSCILQKFRAGNYPAPTGGCVDAQVPLNFVASTK